MNNSLDLLILTQASPFIGHGHVMRCRSLAAEARNRGMSVGFGAQDEYTFNLLQGFGEAVFDPVQSRCSATFLIRDFKEPNPVTEVQQHIADGVVVLLVDELGPARTVASLVTDALMTPQRSLQYGSNSQTKYLYGLAYAPLQRQFAENHAIAAPGRSRRGRLFVSFGGSDPRFITTRFLEALNYEGFRGPAIVVTDGTPENFYQAEQIVNCWDESEVLQNVSDMTLRMKSCDLVATKLGITTLEAFCLGIGCLLIEPTPLHLELQLDLAQAYDSWPALELGLAEKLDFRKAAEKTQVLLQNPLKLSRLGQQGTQLVDGLGAQRIIDELVECIRY